MLSIVHPLFYSVRKDVQVKDELQVIPPRNESLLSWPFDSLLGRFLFAMNGLFQALCALRTKRPGGHIP